LVGAWVIPDEGWQEWERRKLVSGVAGSLASQAEKPVWQAEVQGEGQAEDGEEEGQPTFAKGF
jgi:hypothetical protein